MENREILFAKSSTGSHITEGVLISKWKRWERECPSHHPCWINRRGASTTRNLIAVASLVAIVIAIVLVLNRAQPNAVIVSKDLAPPMPGSALAEQYPLTSMLFTAEIRNDGAAADFDIEVEINDGSQTWKRTTQFTLAKDQTEQIIIDFGTLEGAQNNLDYEVTVTPR